MVWSDEQVERLEELAGRNWSASQIAADLGVTRNAVIGKLHRLGVSTGNRSSVSAPFKAPKPKKPMGGEAQAINRIRARTKPANVIPFPVKIEAKPPLMIATLDLLPHHCRFPYGDPQNPVFGFCGHPKYPGSSYCVAHTKITMPQTIVEIDDENESIADRDLEAPSCAPAEEQPQAEISTRTRADAASHAPAQG
jgi:GcrA cell cycle regulator